MKSSHALGTMIGCTVRVKLRKRNYTLTGVLYRTVVGKIILRNEKTGNDYHIRMSSIGSILDLNTGITVHNFLQDGSEAAISLKNGGNERWKQ